ncbi:MAG: PDZ domain-containing protein [Gammaproteobacteria bacterium]|nr:PDZ domain-containing protein [Gammaproteobacteria bacterium]
MKRLLTGLLACLPLAAYAQDDGADERMRDAERRLEQAAEEIAEASAELAGDSMRHVFKTIRHGEGRAMLGINIGKIRIEREDGSREEHGFIGDGVEIYGVTPGGPADAAGLESGDIILALNGQSLAGHDLPPERRLVELMAGVEPGDSVSLSYRRGKRERTADVVTTEFEPMAFAFGGPGEDFEFNFDGDELPEFMRRLPGMMHLGHKGVWRGLELLPLTEKLGSYFGTDSGMLVVRAPQHEAIPLEEGDVIKQIAGATPKSPPDAMRLLRFYEPGDQVVMEVLRQKRNRTFKITIPDKTTN